MKAYTHLLLFCFTSIISTPLLMALNNKLPEKNIVVVIPSYNNSKWFQKNIESVLTQNYNHFRIIYTDDCSPDGTGNLVEKYLAQYDTKKKVTLIKNSIRKGALHNLYTMIHMCNDNDIVVTLDGDDWLPDNNVLTRLNNVYAKGIWLTYGQFKLHPSQSVGWACAMPDYIVQNNTFRDFQHLPTHLRTFYAWLFKAIKLEDLLYQGIFYPMTWDMAMMFPMIEMASERHQFISDIMYVYNDENSISDHNVSRQLQAHLAQIIKKKARYKRLKAKITFDKIDNKARKNELVADAIVFAQDPQSLTKLLESLKNNVKGIDRIFVIVHQLPSQINAYNQIESRYPKVELYRVNNNFQKILFDIYQTTTHNYILFAKGDTKFEKPVSLYACTTALENSGAYAFYFKLNKQDATNNYPLMPMVECYQNIFAWTFANARDKWSCANSVDLVLHKKTDSLSQVLRGNYTPSPQGIETTWANEGNLERLGLCFNEALVGSIN